MTEPTWRDAIVRAVELTLRQLAEQVPFTGADLREIAEDVAQGYWMCCPICQETTCDEGCPLEEVRRYD